MTSPRGDLFFLFLHLCTLLTRFIVVSHQVYLLGRVGSPFTEHWLNRINGWTFLDLQGFSYVLCYVLWGITPSDVLIVTFWHIVTRHIFLFELKFFSWVLRCVLWGITPSDVLIVTLEHIVTHHPPWLWRLIANRSYDCMLHACDAIVIAKSPLMLSDTHQGTTCSQHTLPPILWPLSAYLRLASHGSWVRTQIACRKQPKNTLWIDFCIGAVQPTVFGSLTNWKLMPVSTETTDDTLHRVASQRTTFYTHSILLLFSPMFLNNPKHSARFLHSQLQAQLLVPPNAPIVQFRSGASFLTLASLLCSLAICKKDWPENTSKS